MEKLMFAMKFNSLKNQNRVCGSAFWNRIGKNCECRPSQCVFHPSGKRVGLTLASLNSVNSFQSHDRGFGMQVGDDC